MTPAEFNDWLAHMELSEVRAAAVLGCAPATVGSMRRGISHSTGKPVRIDKRTALACAALAAGLEPWPECKKDVDDTKN